MRVICNGHKTCDGGCDHGVPHICNNPIYNKNNHDDACNCYQEYYVDLRKKKLEKLKNLDDESNL